MIIMHLTCPVTAQMNFLLAVHILNQPSEQPYRYRFICWIDIMSICMHCPIQATSVFVVYDDIQYSYLLF